MPPSSTRAKIRGPSTRAEIRGPSTRARIRGAMKDLPARRPSKREKETSACAERRQVKYWTYFAQGKREYMEDRWLIRSDDRCEWILFAIMDGHGGKSVAEAMVVEYPKSVFPVLRKYGNTSNEGKLESKIKKAVLLLDERLFKRFGDAEGPGGSTLVSAAYNKRTGRVVLINVGDSQADLFDRKGAVLMSTHLHKPDNSQEKKRIYESGGKVSGSHRVNGVLALSRAMGDFSRQLKFDKTGEYHSSEAPVSAMANVHVLSTHRGKYRRLKTIVLGSDGISDFVSSEDIGATVAKDTEQPAQALVELAYANKSGDNLTALVVRLHHPRHRYHYRRS